MLMREGIQLYLEDYILPIQKKSGRLKSIFYKNIIKNLPTKIFCKNSPYIFVNKTDFKR